jgi:hypothetical protein
MMFSIWLPNRFQSLKHRCKTFMKKYAKRKALTRHPTNDHASPGATDGSAPVPAFVRHL